MVVMLGAREWRWNAPVPEGEARADGPASEIHLLHAGQAGDRTALEQLLIPYERPLYALCRGILGHADDAEDAVQEMFLRALRALSAFRGDSAVRSWLYRIAVNVCLDRKRAEHPTEPWDEERSPLHTHHHSPESLALGRLRLQEALSTLIPRQRAVLLLKELEGWSVADIAAAMRWKEKRVYNELYKARHAVLEWQARNEQEGAEG
jgi:RNA polymerase sigma-70 factor, ECF subfamily